MKRMNESKSGNRAGEKTERMKRERNMQEQLRGRLSLAVTAQESKASVG